MINNMGYIHAFMPVPHIIRNISHTAPGMQYNAVCFICKPSHIIYHEGVSRSHQDQLRDKYGINKKDFVFAMFGGIRRYKGYEKGIMAFDRLDIDDAKLVLAGWGTDVGYAKYLRDLSAHNESIILDLRYIPGITLNALIGISDVIVLPYTNKSSMNSGVMIQAFSNGKTVITPDICMARDFTGQGFFYG